MTTIDTTTRCNNNKEEGSLKLSNSWTIWFLIRPARTNLSANYETALTPIATVQTAQSFWSLYTHLIPPSSLPPSSDYQCFLTGIKPVWEDPSNSTGGKWIIRVRKGLINRLWEHLVVAVMAGTLDGLGVKGVVVSVRWPDDILSVWNGDANDEEGRLRLKDVLKRVLCLPPNCVMEYKAHNVSMKDNSSYRPANASETK